MPLQSNLDQNCFKQKYCFRFDTYFLSAQPLSILVLKIKCKKENFLEEFFSRGDVSWKAGGILHKKSYKPSRTYIVKESHNGSLVGEILRYRLKQTSNHNILNYFDIKVISFLVKKKFYPQEKKTNYYEYLLLDFLRTTKFLIPEGTASRYKCGCG